MLHVQVDSTPLDAFVAALPDQVDAAAQVSLSGAAQWVAARLREELRAVLTSYIPSPEAVRRWPLLRHPPALASALANAVVVTPGEAQGSWAVTLDAGRLREAKIPSSLLQALEHGSGADKVPSFGPLQRTREGLVGLGRRVAADIAAALQRGLEGEV